MSLGTGLTLKPEANPTQVQLSLAGTVTTTSPDAPALSAGTAVAIPAAKTIAGAMTADAMAVVPRSCSS
nr:hypothetical protein JVH1_8712 [Rhodococcus sp. JVH1]